MVYGGAAAWAAQKAAKLAADKVFENRTTLAAFASSAWHRVMDGKTVVIISGMGGAGKTTLQQIFSGEKVLNELSEEYNYSLDNEKTSLGGKFFTSLYTQPGQGENVEFNRKEIEKAIQKARKVLYIPVVSYGYNSLYMTNLEDMMEAEEGKELGLIKEEYFATQRAAEIARIKDMCDLLWDRPDDVQIDIMTVVTKMDLWWSRTREVENYYGSDTYLSAFKPLIDKRKGRNIRHHRSSVCLVLSNMKTKDGHLLAATTSGFDIQTQKMHFYEFINFANTFFGG